MPRALLALFLLPFLLPVILALAVLEEVGAVISAWAEDKEAPHEDYFQRHVRELEGKCCCPDADVPSTNVEGGMCLTCGGAGVELGSAQVHHSPFMHVEPDPERKAPLHTHVRFVPRDNVEGPFAWDLGTADSTAP